MIAARPFDFRMRLMEYLDKAFRGETILISGKENKNVVVISEKEYNELIKSKKNEEYLSMIDKSRTQIEHGEVIIKTMEELEKMEDE